MTIINKIEKKIKDNSKIIKDKFNNNIKQNENIKNILYKNKFFEKTIKIIKDNIKEKPITFIILSLITGIIIGTKIKKK